MRDGCSGVLPDSLRHFENVETRLGWSSDISAISSGMHTFELRLVENGFELRGGPLQEPLVFHEIDPRPAVHLVRFLSQKDGSVLRVLNAIGEVVHARRFEPVIPLRGSVGGLHGPRMIA
jgi:hypothetical protein